MINITIGKPYSDMTFDYHVTTDNKTVGEFIDEFLRVCNKEWGYFGIYEKQNRTSVFGNPQCEYSYGKITTDPLPKKYLDKEIIEVQGSGGWSRSDFLFIVDRSDE